MTLSSLSITYKARYLAAWYHASQEYDWDQDKMIGMWESASAPSGWKVCDGTNGTPDMRDYMIKFDDRSVAGNSTSSLSYSFNYSLASAGGHHHYGGSHQSGSWGYHNQVLGAHSHSGSRSGSVPVPPYYALTFIMKA